MTMTCTVGSAKMPIVLDQADADANSANQSNFILMDLVNKSSSQDAVTNGSFGHVEVEDSYKNMQLNNTNPESRSNLTNLTQELMDENLKGNICYKYLPNVFHANDKNNFVYESVTPLNFNSLKNEQSGNFVDALKSGNKKYKRKLKTKSDGKEATLYANFHHVDINSVQNESASQQMFVIKPIKPKASKIKKFNRGKERTDNCKKGYMLIAPHPPVHEEPQLMVIQKTVPKVMNCSVNTSANPVLIVKIEDDQVKVSNEAKANKVLNYCVDYSNDKKTDGNYLQNSLVSGFDSFNKDKNIDLKCKKFDEFKTKCCKCPNCPFMTLSKELLNSHLQNPSKCFSSNDEIVTCPGCSNIFFSLTPLRVHLVHDHKMQLKEVKKVLQNIHKIHFENSGIEEPQKSSCAYDSNQLVMTGSDFNPNLSSMELPLHNISSREAIEKDNFHEMQPARPREMETCGNKRQTMLESYLDDISNKNDCSLPPPLTENGPDLLENTFNFTAPVSEQLPAIQPPPAHSSSNLDETHLMDHAPNHSFLAMANVFPDSRHQVHQSPYKNSDNASFTNDANMLLANDNYLPTQVHEIQVINLEDNNMGKTSSNLITHEINIDDFSSYQDNGPLDDDDDDCRLSGEEDQEEKKKLKKLGVGYRCDINSCKVRLQSEKNIQYHRRCHEGTLYNCPECCKDCSTWVSLSSHLWQAHKIDMELYKCDQCPYKTPSYSRLTNIHRGIHGKARPFLCDICGKGFKTVKQMRNHKNIHKAKMVRMSVCHCEICGRTVADRRQLELHINNTHKKKKPYLCNVCGYATAVKHSLVVHMRRHTGEKPYKCEKCEYKTADHNALRRHKMKHSGVRSYKCGNCNYTCIQASTYKLHIKTKHPDLETDIIFSCGQCSFQTLNRGSFLSHTSEHENYSSAIRKQPRYHNVKSDVNHGQYYTDNNRINLVEPIMTDRVVDAIVDLSGAQSLLEDHYYEVEKITGDLEEGHDLKFKTTAIG